MNADVLLGISTSAFALACFAAIAVRSLHVFSRSELEEICQQHQAPERFADILRRSDRVALGVEMVVSVVAAIAIATAGSWATQRIDFGTTPPWLAFLLVALLLGLLSAGILVWIPWSIARLAAARFLYRTWPLWSILGCLALPLVWTARFLDTMIHRIFGKKPPHADEESIEEEIRTIVSEGHREGLLEGGAREMIEGVIELGDAAVSHIMTPRTEIDMIQLDTPWEEFIESMIDSGHTRVPIYDKNKDDIAGILYIKDLLPELAKGATEPHRELPNLLRKPLFVPETKPVDDLLRLFQKTRTHIAVVMDEYGQVSGLVTIEDVLEEIVGEIDDEYDQKTEAEIRKIDDDTCEALGRAHVDEINALMDFDLPEESDFDTIGGFAFAEFGRVPAAGESITWQDSIRLTVLEATRRRINRVHLERVKQESLEIA